MVFANDLATARLKRFARRTPEGGAIWRSEYFGPPPSPESSSSVDPSAVGALEYVDPAPGEVREPQAFLVEQEPGAVVHPHFHFVDQFQVVVDGSGTIGKQPVEALAVQFAGACTGYGPIRPGAQGLKYFSLRASADSTGAQYMPAARARMRPMPRRNLFAAPMTPSDAAALRSRTEPAVERTLDAEDGLSVTLLRIPPNGTLAGPDPSEGAGQSVIVVAGTIAHGGRTLGLWGALFVGADEPAYLAKAGPDGAELLFMQYPRKA